MFLSNLYKPSLETICAKGNVEDEILTQKCNCVRCSISDTYLMLMKFRELVLFLSAGEWSSL